jgi:hypothetical protein
MISACGTPTGKREVRFKAAAPTDRKRPELDILIAVGFAAPTVFEVPSGKLSTGPSRHSKSTAQQVRGPFGHPRQGEPNSRPSRQKRLGLTRISPPTGTTFRTSGIRQPFTTMFVAAGGLEGGRLNQTPHAAAPTGTLLVPARTPVLSST